MPNPDDLTAARARGDRVAIWPLALAIGLPAALTVLWSGPSSMAFVGAPILFLVWAGAALLAAAMALYSAWTRAWRRALCLSVLPLATLAMLARAETVWILAMETGERIHFRVMRHSYLDEVSKLPSSGEPRFALWLWGGFGVGHGVVYDESDEIQSPEPSLAWKKRVQNTEVGMCGAWGSALGGHFYLVRTGC